VQVRRRGGRDEILGGAVGAGVAQVSAMEAWNSKDVVEDHAQLAGLREGDRTQVDPLATPMRPANCIDTIDMACT
jgi:hypothetical protein